MTVRVVLLVVSLATGLLAGCLVACSAMRSRARMNSKKAAMRRSGVVSTNYGEPLACDGVAEKALEYTVALHDRIAHGSAKAVTGGMPSPSASTERKFNETIMRAGLRERVSLGAVREARVRLAAVFAAVGFALGACISNELMGLMALAGLCVGAFLPGWALRQEVAARDARLKSELPEMLEVVSLGIASGLTFDRSFGLYPAYFDSSFARDCQEAHRKWTLGFTSREEALKDLARGYDSAVLNRVVQNTVRSMRFGTSLADEFAHAAAESRTEQKAARQELIAKVPVRMMIPTACLILPAMLLLVLGPVLLELIEGF